MSNHSDSTMIFWELTFQYFTFPGVTHRTIFHSHLHTPHTCTLPTLTGIIGIVEAMDENPCAESTEDEECQIESVIRESNDTSGTGGDRYPDDWIYWMLGCSGCAIITATIVTVSMWAIIYSIYTFQQITEKEEAQERKKKKKKPRT